VSPVRVKICGITCLPDLQAAAAAGADALGFVFAPRSRRALSLEEAEALVPQVPAFVARVGLFMDAPAREVERVLERVRLTLLQFHGSEDAGFCRQFGLPYIKAVAMGSAGEAGRAERDFPDAAALLLDSHRKGQVGGTGQSFDWSRIPRLSRPLILAGGLTPENVRRAVREVRPWAVDVSSGVEDAPGKKNAEKIREFIREAKYEQ
jgi:phosphoribosylanthranilate isomerase